MFARFLPALAVLFLLSASPAPTLADDWDDIRERSESLSGFLPLHWDAGEGRLYAEVADFAEPLIYYTGLSQGVGSNDLGLDRGKLGDTQLVQFERHGPKVLLVALNTDYRAESDNARERAAVTEAFAASVLWGFTVAAERDGRVLLDMTDFAQRDAMDLGALLARRGEGNYKVDKSRSAVFLPRTKGFPDNTEIDAILTLTGQPKGNILRTVAPDASAITVHKHHSFVRLPEAGYEPLPFDPRTGYFGGGYYDYATAFDESVSKVLTPRHRLEKVDPDAARSEAVEPIIYYVDSGVPEPVRSALIEGASWWNQAFEAAGYINAFRVELLPEGADPMDIRYNVIQWVHRSTRGWSYGASVRDPRTQEIIKGHVSLGSLRVRQDYLLAEGLTAPYHEGGDTDALREFALSRIRQLSAHEVGHTLGLSHNFAASADNRASVMDYPHPLVTVDSDGQPDLSNAYAVGIGAWDKRAIIWGYQDFPDDIDQGSAREAVVSETLASGLHFITDQHSRVGGGSGSGPAHPLSSLWDNGANPVAELERIMALRASVLNNFSERVVREGEPLARIEDVLVPAFLMHRYQLQAASTWLGGRDFSYALRGDGQVASAPIPASDQRAALEALLDTLDTEALTLSPALISLIPPRPPQLAASRELFPRETGYLFDPASAAATAAQATLAMLLDPKRAARLDTQVMVDERLPTFGEVVNSLTQRVWDKQSKGAAGVIERRVQVATIDALMALLKNSNAATQARATAMATLRDIEAQSSELAKRAGRTDRPAWAAHHQFTAARIAAGLEAVDIYATKPAKTPPGSPI